MFDKLLAKQSQQQSNDERSTLWLQGKGSNHKVHVVCV